MVKEIKTGAVQKEMIDREAKSREEEGVKIAAEQQKAREAEAVKKAAEQQEEKENRANVIRTERESLESRHETGKDIIEEIYNEKAIKAEKTDKGKGILQMIGFKKTAIEKAQSEKRDMTKGLEYITGEEKYNGTITLIR